MRISVISKTKLLATSILISVSLWPFATRAADAQAPLTTIRFSELGVSLGDLYQQMAIDHGIYKAQGIDLQIVLFLRGGPESIAAAASNQVDMGSVGTPILTGISRGLHLKVVGAPAYRAQPFVLVARPEISSVAELKGRDVAFGEAGGGATEAAAYIFNAEKVDINSVRNVGGGSTATSYLALKAGRVAAVIMTEPNVTQAQYDHIGHVLARGEDYFGRYEHSYIFATQAFIDAHPDAVRRFFIANREAIRYARTHQDELIALAKTKLNLSDAVIRASLARLLPRWDDSGAIDPQGLLNAVKIVQQLGDINKDYQPSLAQIADLRFVAPDSAPTVAFEAPGKSAAPAR